MNQLQNPSILLQNNNVDIQAYFRRINYTGTTDVSLSTLTSIHLAHTHSIPFENLNPLSKRPVKLDLRSIEEKLIHDGRGGYCFEHNILLSQVLRSLGFEVQWLAGRVMYNVPEGVVPARGHMLLLVIIDQAPYIADAGFGSLTLPVPVRLEADKPQETPYERFRLLNSGGEWILQAEVRNEWKSLYRFTLQEQLLPDYEVTNYYLSTHPNSHFTFSLLAAKLEGGKRFVLRNNEFATHSHGETDRRPVNSAEELRELLIHKFSISLPDELDIHEIFKKILSRN